MILLRTLFSMVSAIRLKRVVETLAAFLQAVLEKNLGIDTAAVVMIQLGGVNRYGVLDLLEEVLVVHDVAELLVFAVEPVGAANGLKEAVILHTLIDVEIGTGRRIKSGQQLVHHDQELHVGGLLLEPRLGPLLVDFGFRYPLLGRNVFQQLVVGAVDELLVGLSGGAGIFRGDVPGLRIVGNHRAP